MKKKIGGILSNRLVMGAVFLTSQLILFAIVITFLGGRWNFLSHFFQILSIVMIIWLVRKNDNPAYKIAWIIIILMFPLFGGVFYLFWGNTPINQARKMKKIKNLDKNFYEQIGMQTKSEEIAEYMPKNAKKIRYIENLAGAPVWRNTECKYYKSGEKSFESMKTELRKAEKFIFMEYFIIEQGELLDQILDILVEKAKQGVDVRILYDDAGSLSKLPGKFDAYLESLGLKVHKFNPLTLLFNAYLNNRDHRKICVIDGNIGFMGGFNLADEYINKVERFGYWKDTSVLLRGEAVSNLTIMFLQLWDFDSFTNEDIANFMPTMKFNSTGYVQPFSDSPLDSENVGETIYMQIVNEARKYVYITTPYLALDNEMITALCTAAKSGIDVRIMMPGVPDKPSIFAVTRSYYLQLIQAGVKIYEYEPGFLHAKMIVSDDDIAVVGTINMDFRSFYLHFECGTVFYEGVIPYKVKDDFENMLSVSRAMTEDWCKKTPWLASIWASVLRILAPMM